MKNRSVLITGATGIMGSWVLGEALDRGYDPVVLMRDKDPGNARKRIAAVLNLVGRNEQAGRVRIVQGDTSEKDLGMEPGVVARLRSSLGGMVHCAACTSFNPRQDSELWTTNVGGVANVLRFLSGTGIPLYHVSTAYVAGKRTGVALETELNLSQDFNNTYERSKCESEQLVHVAIAKKSVQAAIFRPGILVGATVEGRITQFLNFYQFLRFIDFAPSVLDKYHGRLRVRATPDGTKNIVPVDWSAEAMWHIIEREGPSAQTYHLTNPRPVTHRKLQQWASHYLGITGIDFVDRLESPISRLERVANASFRLYSAYMHGEPEFDATNTRRALNGSVPFPAMGPEFYTKLLSFARTRDWQGIFGCKTKAAGVSENDGDLAARASEVWQAVGS